MFKATFNPTVIVKQDFSEVFESRVKKAIAFNKEHGIDMLPEIIITSGPYRSYCMSYERNTSKGIVNLDFYSASRVFGFDHSIEDIACAISTSMSRVN